MYVEYDVMECCGLAKDQRREQVVHTGIELHQRTAVVVQGEPISQWDDV